MIFTRTLVTDMVRFCQVRIYHTDLAVTTLCMAVNENSSHVTGTFMCPRNAPTLCDGHIYVPSDVVCNIYCVVKMLG